MSKFRIEFLGKLNGAIGAPYRIVETREAETPRAAVLQLYEVYDHITHETVTNEQTGEKFGMVLAENQQGYSISEKYNYISY